MSNNIKGWLIARSIFPLLSFQKVVLIGLPGLGRQCARGGRGLSLPTSPINTRSFTCRHLEAERHGGNLVVLVSNQKTTFGSPLHLPVLNLFWLNLVRKERRGDCRRDKKNGGESLGWAEQRWLDVGEQAWDAV